ncbi:hypothetical protein GA0070616_4589 [Micromonospora nigra]|uniref:Uncharacterized protein n=1 Tax=Micromonospora nigra TaxID=145857 RepID=A0A1C6SU73_9ACTN|nr:hypothetical protein [Micromonospora nigra]SCL32919.1 hypothetical protein GA0070616_4589 [Micromonospora nigra]
MTDIDLAYLGRGALDAFAAGMSQGGDPGAQQYAARAQGQIVCDFPHDTLDPAHPGGAFAACPMCGAAL